MTLFRFHSHLFDFKSTAVTPVVKTLSVLIQRYQCHFVDLHMIRVRFGVLTKLHHPLGCPLRVRTYLAKDFSCRPDVVLGFVKQLRPLHCYADEKEVCERWIAPGDVEVSVNFHQLLTGDQSLIGFELTDQSHDSSVESPGFVDESPNGWIVTGATCRENDSLARKYSILRVVGLFSKTPLGVRAGKTDRSKCE